MFKNTASQKAIFFAFNVTTNAPVAGDGGNITAYVSKDYGTVTVLGDTSATEMDATNAKGYYLFDLTQAETNADSLLFSAKSVTANIVVIGVPGQVFTLPVNFSTLSVNSSGQVDVIKLAGQTVTAAAGVTFPSSVASPTNITAGTITTTTNLTNLPTIPVNWLTASGLATDAAVEIAGKVWDEVLTGATHNITNSAGKLLRTITPSSTPLRTGTAQGGSSNSITLDSGASAVDNFYIPSIVSITAGTGAGQSAIGSSYNGTSKVYTITDTFATPPDATSVFSIDAFGQVVVAAIAQDAVNASALATSAVAEIAAAILATPGNLLNIDINGNVTVGNYATGKDPFTLVMKGDMSSITGEAARSPINALRFLRNKWSITTGTLTVTKEDDTTSAWTSALTVTAGADPITGFDPA